MAGQDNRSLHFRTYTNPHTRTYSNRISQSSQPNNLLIRLIICLILVAVTAGVKAWFPRGAEAVSDAVLGDGGYATVFSNFGESVSEGDGVKQAFFDMVSQLVSIGQKVE